MHPPDSVCAISKSRNGLRSANAIYLMHAAQICCYERSRIDCSVRSRRCTDNNTRYSSNTGRCRKHIHHGGKRAFPAWHIKPYRCYRRDLLTGYNTWFDFCEPLLMRHLSFMECSNIANSMLDGFTHCWVEQFMSLLNFIPTDSQPIW